MNIFQLVGSMVLKGADKVNQQLTATEKSAERLKKGLRIAGAAFTALGVAGLALIQSTKKINAELGKTAINLGVTTKEMRDLTLATTNVTFPIKEVVATFDLLARAGVKDTQILKKVATAFDTLGDAIGLGASQVTELMVPAMKTFGLTAEEMAEKIDIMTYLTRHTTMSLDDFNTMVGYTTPELVEMGLTIDDLTAILIHMERQGFAPGRVMTREFNKAVTEATELQIPLTEAIGITSEELEGYKAELAGATGMTQEYADEANKQYTLMDKLKQKWSELTLGASAFLEPLEPILAGMTALGPLMMGLSMMNIPKLVGGLKSLSRGFLTAGASAMKAVAGFVVASAAKIWAWASMVPFAGIALGIAGVAALTLSILGIRRLMKAREGGIFTKPTLALIGEAGPEAVIPLSKIGPSVGGAGVGIGTTITNYFNISELVVREDADLPRIARELYRLQQGKVRAVGG